MQMRQAILLTMCFLSLQTWAQTTERVKVSTILPKVVIESPISPSDWKKQPEAIALEEQNKVIKQYHSTLTDTVYFALSLVGGVAALLVGASFLINFKLYESDKERINEKMVLLRGELDVLRRSQLDSTVALRSELEANSIAHAEKAKTESIISVQAQLAAYADRASNEMVGLRAEILSAAERSETKSALIQKKLEGLEAVYRDLRKEIAHVEAIAREAEAEALGIQQYDGAKLITLCQALKAATKSEQAWNVEGILGNIEETLQNYVDSKRKGVSASTLDMVKEWAEKTAGLSKENSSKVLALVAEIESFRNAALS
jgi:hypothetical protein